MSGVSNLVPAARRDLGDGFLVLRAVPTMAARSVGPFVFVDHFGPTTMAPGKTMDVRPHPHIGLATVTYLFTGSIIHRDSLGTVTRPTRARRRTNAIMTNTNTNDVPVVSCAHALGASSWC